MTGTCILNRGELITPTDQASLTVQFKDYMGNPVNTDTFPTISIVQPSGLIFFAPTSVGIQQLGIGQYSYIYTAPIGAQLGVWNDVWVGYINGYRTETTFEFIVSTTQYMGTSSDGYLTLGADPGFDYSQCAIKNINKLLKSLRARLNSSGKAKAADSYGNTIYVDCDIFSTDVLTTFLATALWQFNQIPYFTFFKFDEDCFVDQWGEILVESATLQALASKALIERGREFQITDNGLSFNPPTVSELMQTQYATLLTSFDTNLKYIKNSIRPHPLSQGVFGMNNGINPAVRNLRNLRRRRLL